MAYGRVVKGAVGMALRSSPLGGAVTFAKAIPGLGSLLGGMSASEKRLKSRARLDKLLAKASAGTLTEKGRARLEKKAAGPYAKQAAKAKAALTALNVGNMTQSMGGESPSVGAGPMSLAWAKPKRRSTTRRRSTKRTVRRVARKAKRTVRRVRRGRMPAALARYWAGKRRKRRAARTLARD